MGSLFVAMQGGIVLETHLHIYGGLVSMYLRDLVSMYLRDLINLLKEGEIEKEEKDCELATEGVYIKVICHLSSSIYIYISV